MVLRQAGSVISQKMNSIRRCGREERWKCGGPERYEIEVDVIMRTLISEELVELVFLRPASEHEPATLLGVASA